MADRGDPPKGQVPGDEQMLLQAHRRSLWAQWASLALGAWLLASPWSFGSRSLALAWSDAVTGGLVVLFSLANLRLRSTYTRWASCFAGLWLLFAPLVFWAPDAATLNNDWLVGGLLVALNVLYPMMPGRAHHMVMMEPGPTIPPGWSYNPSTWLQRGPIIALSLLAFLMARYMAGVQLGHVETAWDPFFGAGAMNVLHSDVSRAWPVSDAGLGAVAYLVEALMGFMGGETRWRTMPWMVLLFGILVIPLGVTSIVLVMLQPIAVGAWCTLCLVTALLMLVMIPLALDEVVAMLQFMLHARREGQDLWRAFWIGGTLDVVTEDERTPDTGLPERRDWPAMVWGITLPWALVAGALLGIALLFLPFATGMSGAAATNVWLSATLATVVAVLAWAEIARPFRVANVVLGLWLALSMWFMPGSTTLGTVIATASGLSIALLGLPRGPVRERYGEWTDLATWRVHAPVHRLLGGRRRTT